MHDPGKRRKVTRGGRQKGCYIYIPAEILQETSTRLSGPVTHYRTWAGKDGSVLVRLYPCP